MRHLVAFAITLIALWLALSGLFKPVLLGLGLVSAGLVLWLSHRMDVLGAEHDPVLMFSWRLPVYWAWLLWQIAVSNIQVAGCVLRPRRINPQVIEVRVTQDTPVARVTYANSVTLTPGTVTLSLGEDRMQVHALHQASADSLKSGDMARWVSWLEGATKTRAAP